MSEELTPEIEKWLLEHLIPFPIDEEGDTVWFTFFSNSEVVDMKQREIING